MINIDKELSSLLDETKDYNIRFLVHMLLLAHRGSNYIEEYDLWANMSNKRKAIDSRGNPTPIDTQVVKEIFNL